MSLPLAIRTAMLRNLTPAEADNNVQTLLTLAQAAQTTAEAAAVAVAGVNKATVGLSLVDNTRDIDKPVSTLQAEAIAAVLTGGTPTTKASIGLGNVDNTADLSKPVSAAQAAADTAILTLAVARGNHTGTQLAATISDLQATVDARVSAIFPNVDNTRDAVKPVSAAQAAYADAKVQNNMNASTTVAPSATAINTALAAAVTGLLDLKSAIDASTQPNYPAASKGDVYIVSAAGKVGGAAGKSVDIGDWVAAFADNAGGLEATVGTNWYVFEHNLTGVLLASDNLAAVAVPATARANLGAAALGVTVKVVAGTTYTVILADKGLHLIFTAGAGCATTMPAGLGGDFGLTFAKASGAGDLTWVPSGTTLQNESSSMVMSAANGMGSLSPTNTANVFTLGGPFGPSAAGAGTVTSVGITQPAAGITAAGGPVTGAGAITLALADDLAAVEALATTGLVRRTGANTWATSADWVAEVALASAATTDIGTAASINVSISGVAAITSLGSAPAGTYRKVRFTGAATLTHNSTSLVCPGGANITAAAGDTFGATSLAAGNWKVDWYQRADGTSLVGSGAAASPALVIEDVAGTTYTYLEADSGKTKRFTNAAGCVATVPAGLSVGWNSLWLRAASAGLLTFVGSGATVVGANASGSLVANGWFGSIVYDTTNVFKVAGLLGGIASIASGKTLTVSNTLSLTGTDGSSIAAGAGGTLAYLDKETTYTKGRAVAEAALVDAATVAVDMSVSNNFYLLFTSAVGNTRACGVPSSPKSGQSLRILTKQDATGGRNFTFPSAFKVDATMVPVTTANALNCYVWTYSTLAGNVWVGGLSNAGAA